MMPSSPPESTMSEFAPSGAMRARHRDQHGGGRGLDEEPVMKRWGRKLLIPAVGVALATSGFAFLSTNTVDKSYAGTGSGEVGAYTVYNIAYTQCDSANGNICYAHFDVIPTDLSHSEAADAAFAQVKFDGSGWVDCERSTAFGGADSLDRNYTATDTSGTGTPESSWICDLRGPSGTGASAAANHFEVTVAH
jgi:hypothetical protein